MSDILIFLLLAGIALVFKWLTAQASNDSDTSEPPASNEPSRPPPQTEEERVRRFLEALGQPPGSPPPPRVQPRPQAARGAVAPREAPTRRRGWAQPLPPVVTVPEDLTRPTLPPLVTSPPQERPAAPVPSELRRPSPDPAVLIVAKPEMAPRQRSAPPPRSISAARVPAIDSLGTALHSRDRLRQLVLFREILGPPRGLQPLDELRSF